MKAKALTAILAAFMLTMTACGTISPPIQNAVTETTTTTTAESIHDSAASSGAESSLEDEKIKTDTFIAEFFDSDISFVDTSELVEWLTKSANDGNEYAQNMLNNMAQFENAVLANTIFGLFANLSRCIEDDYTQKYRSVRRTVDSRLRRMIHRKKQSLGIKDDQSQSYEQSY